MLIGLEPEIFVWEKVPPDGDWRQAEKEAITFWQEVDVRLPYEHPPQTPKSTETIIKKVALLNVTRGG
jgi:hypothetical protein